jgi:hypothetical protein
MEIRRLDAHHSILEVRAADLGLEVFLAVLAIAMTYNRELERRIKREYGVDGCRSWVMLCPQ